jgi:alkanesulfonate monooxygenase SsuD/methylene tetrahydromethanopterin reductase-like flavin-dependent oxidoreductase (luciferase family)
MEFGVAYTVGSEPGRSLRKSFDIALKEIQLAEQLGFTTMMISSQHFEENDIIPSPLIACSFLAAQTKKMRMGPGINLFPLAYHPIHVAEECAVFDVLSDGRLVFGMGQGFRKEEFAGFGVSRKERASRVREGATIIRKLWTEDHVNYDGHYWKLQDVSLRPKPLQKPNPPIWISGEKTSAVRIAGEVADGWFADPKQPLNIIRSNIKAFHEEYRKTGRDPRRAQIGIWRELYVSETDKKAWEEAGRTMREEFEKYLAWEHLVDDEGNILPPSRTDLLDHLVQDRFVAGGPERVIEALKEYKEMGITHFVAHIQFVGLPTELVQKAMRILMEKVAPYV